MSSLQVSDSNVRVCVFSPGYVSTNLSKNALAADGKTYGKMVSRGKERMQQGRRGDEEMEGEGISRQESLKIRRDEQQASKTNAQELLR
jgi:NAD(P)-dependent dehydrogenase (short-subunit alcohol dehydrogenase family)